MSGTGGVDDDDGWGPTCLFDDDALPPEFQPDMDFRTECQGQGSEQMSMDPGPSQIHPTPSQQQQTAGAGPSQVLMDCDDMLPFTAGLVPQSTPPQCGQVPSVPRATGPEVCSPLQFLSPGLQLPTAGPIHQQIGMGPLQTGLGPQHTGLGPQQIGLGPQHTGPGTQQIGMGPQHTGLGPEQLGLGPQHTGPGTQQAAAGLSYEQWVQQVPDLASLAYRNFCLDKKVQELQQWVAELEQQSHRDRGHMQQVLQQRQQEKQVEAELRADKQRLWKQLQEGHAYIQHEQHQRAQLGAAHSYVSGRVGQLQQEKAALEQENSSLRAALNAALQQLPQTPPQPPQPPQPLQQQLATQPPQPLQPVQTVPHQPQDPEARLNAALQYQPITRAKLIDLSRWPIQALEFWQAFNAVGAGRYNQIINDYMPDNNDSSYNNHNNAFNEMKRMVRWIVLYALYEEQNGGHPFDLHHAAQVIDGLDERRNNAQVPCTMNEWLRSSPHSGWRKMEPRQGEPLYRRLLDSWLNSTAGGKRYLGLLELKGAGMNVNV